MSDHFPIILSLDINKSNRLNIVNKYNTKHNLINDVTVYHFSIFFKTVNWNFLKLIIQKLHGIYLLILLFINLIFITLYMKIENIKKNVFHGIQKKLKKNVGLNKNFIKNIN